MGEIVVVDTDEPFVGIRWPFLEPEKLDLRGWKDVVLKPIAGNLNGTCF